MHRTPTKDIKRRQAADKQAAGSEGFICVIALSVGGFNVLGALLSLLL